MKKSKRINLTILTMVFVFICSFALAYNFSAPDGPKPWPVPETAKKMKNPVKGAESIATGKTLYVKHCKSCHGTKGLGDGTKSKELDTDCGDFSKKEFQSQTDGEMLYKIKEGRKDMPSFKKKITDDEELWSIVNYMRTL